MFDIEKNLQSTCWLRGFSTHFTKSCAELTMDVLQLATLPFLTPPSLGILDSPRRTCQWICASAQLRYVFYNDIKEPTILTTIALAPSLRSVAMCNCSGVATIAPLQGAEEMECLHLGGHGDITAYKPFHRMERTRSPSVRGRSFDGWEILRNITYLARLRVECCSDSITSMDGLAAAAPYPRLLKLCSLNGIELVGPARLDHLETLSIIYCDRLRTVDLTGFNWLQELTVFYCPCLTTMVLGEGLASLTSIYVEYCEALVQLDLSGCTAPRTALVSECELLPQHLPNWRRPPYMQRPVCTPPPAMDTQIQK